MRIIRCYLPVLLLAASGVNAQGPPNEEDGLWDPVPHVPVDQAVSFLICIGVLYEMKILGSRKK